MKKNVGKKDSLIRIVLAVVIILVALFLVEGTVLRITAAIVAAVLAITSFINMCPIYHMLGKNTCDAGEPAEAPTTEEPASAEEAAAPAAEEPTETDEVATSETEDPQSTPEESKEPVERS